MVDCVLGNDGMQISVRGICLLSWNPYCFPNRKSASIPSGMRGFVEGLGAWMAGILKRL